MIEHGELGNIGPQEIGSNSSLKRENRGFSKFQIAAKVLGPAVMFLAIASACETDAQDNPPVDHTPICDPTGSFFENELIVRSKGEEISEEVQKIFSDFEARVILEAPRPGGGESVLVEVDPDKRDELEKVLDGRPDVKYAEKSFVIRTQRDSCP